MAVPFKLGVGHTIILTDDHGGTTRYTVRQNLPDGWLVEPRDQSGLKGERIYFSGETIERHYLMGRFKYEPWDDDVIPEARKRRFALEFASQPEAARLKALRRREIVLACEKAIHGGMSKTRALATVPAELLEKRGPDWLAEDTAIAKAKFDRREQEGRLKPGEYFKPPKMFKNPCPRTTWSWLARWVESGGSIESLLDDHAGKNAGRSFLTKEQDEEINTYFSDHVKSQGGFDPGAGFRELERILKSKGVPPITRRTYNRRLKKRFNDLQLARASRGVKATRRLGKISDPGPLPLWPLHQVEADHALVNMRVADEETGINLGRPWISVVRDRLTGMPTGLHLSFLSPSWATASRAIAHSMWPKDLTGLPHLENEWPAHGTFDELYTDRGMDFISNAGRAASAELKFEILNLPGFAPWLKGGLERWNRTFKAEIMSYRDGIKSFDDPELRGSRFPQTTKAELRSTLLTWLVDDHISNGSSGLTENCSSLEAWLDGVARHGPPRPIADMGRFRRMTMVPKRRSIQTGRGVELDGYFFNDLDGRLARAKADYPAPDYLILFDPWDMGYIELLAGNEWILLLNTQPELTGISRYRSEQYWDDAKERATGKRVGIDDFLRSRERLDMDAERVLAIGKRINRHGSSQNALGKFKEQGDFITPVPLRDLRFERPPVEVEGWIESGGVLRPQQPTMAGPGVSSGQTRSPTSVPTFSPEPSASPQVTAQADDAASSDLLTRLAAASRARARQLSA